MIKPGELRIGNYVTVNNPKYHPGIKGVILKIFGITPSSNGHSINLNTLHIKDQIIIPFVSQYLQFIEPIPLTEEILLKCNFVAMDYGTHIQYGHNLFWQLTYHKKVKRYSFVELERSIKYLHQLQNLYFALTEKELTINL